MAWRRHLSLVTSFIGDDSACLVLVGDIFYGVGVTSLLKNAVSDADENKKATVFGYWVHDPERYGVAEFDKQGNCLSIEEKPKEPIRTILSQGNR